MKFKKNYALFCSYTWILIVRVIWCLFLCFLIMSLTRNNFSWFLLCWCWISSGDLLMRWECLWIFLKNIFPTYLTLSILWLGRLKCEATVKLMLFVIDFLWLLKRRQSFVTVSTIKLPVLPFLVRKDIYYIWAGTIQGRKSVFWVRARCYENTIGAYMFTNLASMFITPYMLHCRVMRMFSFSVSIM